MQYQANLPYPEIKNIPKNILYAKILSFAYAGSTSEETAVHQYIYQSYFFKDDIKDILEHIAIVEMKHSELLGQVILKLGLNPKYEIENDEILPWTAAYIPYCEDKVRCFDIDIESEKKAIENYQKMISIIQDKTIQDLLKRIILDEEIHISIFENLKEKYKKAFK